VKTIADYAVEVLIETDNPGVQYGDTRLLDDIAERATHTNLMDKHPLTRHSRILDALDRDSRFEKYYIKMNGYRGPHWRQFKLIQKPNESKVIRHR